MKKEEMMMYKDGNYVPWDGKDISKILVHTIERMEIMKKNNPDKFKIVVEGKFLDWFEKHGGR